MRHDVHFTRYGCFLCYQTLLETLTHIDAAEIIREADLREREIFVAGDVAHAAGERGRSVRFHEPPAVEHRSILKGTSYKTYQVDVQVSEAPSGRRLVIFRTSNSTHLIPFLLRHFSRITAVATLRVFYDLIESEQPHVVISEMPERYLAVENLSADSHALNAFAPDDDGKFEEETGHSLPLPEE